MSKDLLGIEPSRPASRGLEVNRNRWKFMHFLADPPKVVENVTFWSPPEIGDSWNSFRNICRNPFRHKVQIWISNHFRKYLNPGGGNGRGTHPEHQICSARAQGHRRFVCGHGIASRTWETAGKPMDLLQHRGMIWNRRPSPRRVGRWSGILWWIT